VREGRRREFKRFPEFSSEAAREHIPDPNALSTFAASRLDWSVPEQPEHRAWLDLVRRLMRVREETIVPRLGGIRGNSGEATILSDSALRVAWTLGDGSTLELVVNLADQTSEVRVEGEVEGDVLFATHPDLPAELRAGRLPPWSVLWLLNQRAR
jgi:maltooligosyltrehalose trehalohydrolase